MRPPTAPGSLPHLVARFFDVLFARPLTDAERSWVRAVLEPAFQSLFFAQSPADQRHGLVTARRVEHARPGRPDLVRAALLHDVGKRHARLGVIGRVLASLAMLVRIPIRGRFAVYRDHGPIAAAELRELGAEPLVWRYAAAHHHPRDPEIGPGDWDVLERADAGSDLRMTGNP